jgi:hypothetical protein
MLDVYASWIEGADASQIATIERAMQGLTRELGTGMAPAPRVLRKH